MATLTGYVTVSTLQRESGIVFVVEALGGVKVVDRVTRLAGPAIRTIGELIAVHRLVARPALRVPGLEPEIPRRTRDGEQLDRRRRVTQLFVADHTRNGPVRPVERVAKFPVGLDIDPRRAKRAHVVASAATGHRRPCAIGSEATRVRVVMALLAPGFQRRERHSRPAQINRCRKRTEAGTLRPVARGTSDFRVPTVERQLELGVLSHGERTRFPALDSMARLARTAIFAVGQLFRVSVLVTVRAALVLAADQYGRSSELGQGDSRGFFDVATIAPYLGVLALQGIRRLSMCGDGVSRRFEELFVMTGVAVDLASGQSRLAGVWIHVAPLASIERRILAPGLGGVVALGALGARVTAHEQEPRLRMVEALAIDNRETIGDVASGAVGPESTGVRVLMAVGAALVWNRLVPRSRLAFAADQGDSTRNKMALLAGELGVLAGQGKRRPRMIEAYRGLPARSTVTRLAVRPERLPVRVFVTCQALAFES